MWEKNRETNMVELTNVGPVTAIQRLYTNSMSSEITDSIQSMKSEGLLTVY